MLCLDEWKGTLLQSANEVADEAGLPDPSPARVKVVRMFCDRAWALMDLALKEGGLPDPSGGDDNFVDQCLVVGLEAAPKTRHDQYHRAPRTGPIMHALGKSSRRILQMWPRRPR